jgi:raffinose/stachyose/melibiose transport system substrate-binding protein
LDASRILCPEDGQNIDVIKDFFAFVASTEGTDAMTAKVTPAGPYLIKGATLPDDVLPFVNDLNAYIESGNSYPALEFLSPSQGSRPPSTLYFRWNWSNDARRGRRGLR